MSSSVVDGALGTLLDDALVVLERDAPEYLRAIAECVEGLAIEVCTGGEQFAIVSDGARLARTAAAKGSSVLVRTSTRSVLRMLDGETTLLRAIRDDEVILRGAVAAVGRLEEALVLFLHGCVRCSDAPLLLRTLRNRQSGGG